MKKIEDYPIENYKDKLFGMTKAGVNLIPTYGGAISETLSTWFSSPVEKRRQKWNEELVQIITELQEERNNLEKLFENEMFITTVLRATEIAIKSHQDEKIQYLKSIVINSVLLTDMDDTKKMLYLEIIGSYTPLHIILLNYMDNPKKKLEKLPNNQKFSCLYSDFIFECIPELENDEIILKKLQKDLFNDGLITTMNYGDISYSANPSGKNEILEEIPSVQDCTTHFGKDFLRYLDM